MKNQLSPLLCSHYDLLTIEFSDIIHIVFSFFFQWSTHAACRSDDRNPVTLTEGIFTDPASKKSYSIKQAYDKV